MKATFENTVDILVKAFINDTLERSNCFACAVGNIVAHHYGITEWGTLCNGRKVWKSTTLRPKWQEVFITDCKTQTQNPLNYAGTTKFQIDITGYSWEELARIEYAFETAPKPSDKEVAMFKGLMAVVEVLADIHGISLEAKESAKQLFVKV